MCPWQNKHSGFVGCHRDLGLGSMAVKRYGWIDFVAIAFSQASGNLGRELHVI